MGCIVTKHSLLVSWGRPLLLILSLLCSIVANAAMSTGAEVVPAGWWGHCVALITNPTITYLLLMLAIYGIFCELLHPGLILPGVVGSMAMLLALYALHLMPVNYLGLGLIILGLAFVIAEGLSPSFGILGLGGTVGFIIGSILLMDSHHIAPPVIAAMSVINIALFIVLLGAALKARRQKVKNGLATLIGARGRSLRPIHADGQAIIRGEIWNVHAQEPIAADKLIQVVGVNGLLLKVVALPDERECARNLSQGE